jgi:hypothetical protein
LTKYITKQVLSIDLLGMQKGKRMWATTLPDVEKPESLWLEEPDQPGSVELRGELESYEAYGVDLGWEPVHGKGTRYRLWVREMGDAECPIVRLDGKTAAIKDTRAPLRESVIASAIKLVEEYSKKHDDEMASG